VAASFEVFITADQSLPFQQNLAALPLGVIIVAAQSTALEDLLPLVPSVLQTIPQLRPGEVRRVGPP
jgi:hypothetical protein